MNKSTNSRTKRRKKIETSKKLLIFTVAMFTVVSIATIVAVFVLQDSTPLEFLIAAVGGCTSTAYGFYYWKAKNENISRYGNNVPYPEPEPEVDESEYM